MDIKEFLLTHKSELLDYFEDVKVNDKKTLINFGGSL